MGQYATLYRVDKINFENLVAPGKPFVVSQLANENVLFQKTQDGLVFVLSKNQSAEIRELVAEIFHPTLFIGEEPDLEAINQDPDNFDFNSIDLDNLPVRYNDPTKIAAINAFLDKISNDLFLTNFNPEELNREGIYPWVWNMDEDEDTSFNERHILEDFVELKKILKKAQADEDYILSYVG